jgi:LCP family protein required for cell wall assembly
MSIIKHYFKYVISAVVAVALVTVSLVALQIWENHQGTFPGDNVTENGFVEHNGIEYALKDNIETFLVIGLDKYEGSSTADSYNNDKQADFLMLFVFDNEAKKFTAIHINRDTMTDVNVLGVAGNKIYSVEKQIALAHTYGNGRDVSCRNTADAVSGLLMGTKVNHYMSVTLDAVPVFNDLVGGVELTVMDDFTGIDPTLVKGETVTLNGQQALTYVRTRYGLEDSTNTTRMKRQRQYMDALYEQFQSCVDADDEFILEASVKMSDYMISDRSVTQLQTLANKFNEYDFVEICEIEGESKKGAEFMEFYPYESSIKETVISLFYEPAKQ